MSGLKFVKPLAYPGGIFAGLGRGLVYLAKDANGKEYVVKSTYTLYEQSDDIEFQSEVEIMIAAGAPVVMGVETELHTGSIVMERLFEARSGYDWYTYTRVIFEKLWALHEIGIFHNDAYSRNVLFRVKGEDDLDPVFIDFGMSILFIQPVPSPLRYVDFVSICFGHRSGRGFDGGIYQAMLRNPDLLISLNMNESEVFYDTWKELVKFLSNKEKKNFVFDHLQWAYQSRVCSSWDYEKNIPLMNKNLLPRSSAVYRYIDTLLRSGARVSELSRQRLQNPDSPVRRWNINPNAGLLPKLYK